VNSAGHHEQLLELLRALRQGVHGARLEARRHDEVAGALGGGLDQVGRLDLDEAVGVVGLADGLHQPAPQEQAAGHRLAPDVEVAVSEAEALVDRRIGVVDVERRRLGVVEDPDLARLELDLARLELRVLGAGLAARDDALDRDDELRADLRGDLVGVGRIGRVDHDLGDPVAVPQVDEDELAVVPPPVDPPRQHRIRAVVVRAELPAGVGAVRRGERGGFGGHGRTPGCDCGCHPS
jgi:hypothetical protein